MSDGRVEPSFGTVLVDADGAGIWIDDDGDIGLDEFYGEAGACIGFKPTSEQSAKLAELLARTLPPEVKAKLCRGLLGVTRAEAQELAHAAKHARYVNNDNLGSLSHKLQGRDNK